MSPILSTLTITTTRRDENEGFRLTVHQAHDSVVEPAPPTPGTTVEVRQLFANLPARRRFLSRPQAETTAIRNVIRDKAAPFPEIRFTLKDGIAGVSQHAEEKDFADRTLCRTMPRLIRDRFVEVGILQIELLPRFQHGTPAATGRKDRYQARLVKDVQIGLDGLVVEFDVFCQAVPIQFARRYCGEIGKDAFEVDVVFRFQPVEAGDVFKDGLLNDSKELLTIGILSLEEERVVPAFQVPFEMAADRLCRYSRNESPGSRYTTARRERSQGPLHFVHLDYELEE